MGVGWLLLQQKPGRGGLQLEAVSRQAAVGGGSVLRGAGLRIRSLKPGLMDSETELKSQPFLCPQVKPQA